MSLSAADKASIVDAHKRSDQDTGSPEVQIALLTRKIEVLSEHMKANKHDYHSRRGLLRFVSQRRKLLDYLKRVEIERYRAIIKKLGLRN